MRAESTVSCGKPIEANPSLDVALRAPQEAHQSLRKQSSDKDQVHAGLSNPAFPGRRVGRHPRQIP